MISRTFGRAVLGAFLVAGLLASAAQADNWARDNQPAFDDPAIATALRDRATKPSNAGPMDPAIRAALLDRASASTRPDDRAGTRGVGSLPAQEHRVSDAFDWGFVGIGAGATFVLLLLGFSSLLALRHGRARVTNA